MAAHDGFQLLTGHNGVGGGSRANEDVHLVERCVPVVEMNGQTADLIRQGSGAVECAVCHDDGSNATGAISDVIIRFKVQ